MHRIEIHRDAELEISEASRYYESRVEGLGERFLDEVEQGFGQILRFPLAWSVYEGEYRRCLLKRFPYGLVYRTDKDVIYILAVSHLQRKPGYWKDRG